MIESLLLFIAALRVLISGQAALVAQNLALRQQLAIYKRSAKRPKMGPHDRLFWVWLSRSWSGWQSALVIVHPATVVGWRRQGFRLYWRWKSRGGANGRPRVDWHVQALIRRMSRKNPL